MSENTPAVEWETWFAHWLDQQAPPNVTEMLPGGIRVFEHCESTQDECMKIGKAGHCCVALRQSKGRGRLGRKWDDGAGTTALLTIALPMNTTSPNWIECLSIQAGVACCRAAEHFVTNQNPPREETRDSAERLPPEEKTKSLFGIRWPNDVMAQGRKLAGILIETRTEIAFLGIGLNVHANQWDGELIGKTVSLQELTRHTIKRTIVIAEILTNLAEVIKWDHAHLKASFAERDILCGRICTFVVGGSKIQGLVESVDPTRGLLVRPLDPNVPGGMKREAIHLPAQLTSLLAITDELNS